jgi:hypothetical protein
MSERSLGFWNTTTGRVKAEEDDYCHTKSITITFHPNEDSQVEENFYWSLKAMIKSWELPHKLTRVHEVVRDNCVIATMEQDAMNNQYGHINQYFNPRYNLVQRLENDFKDAFSLLITKICKKCKVSNCSECLYLAEAREGKNVKILSYIVSSSEETN